MVEGDAGLGIPVGLGMVEGKNTGRGTPVGLGIVEGENAGRGTPDGNGIIENGFKLEGAPGLGIVDGKGMEGDTMGL